MHFQCILFFLFWCYGIPQMPHCFELSAYSSVLHKGAGSVQVCSRRELGSPRAVVLMWHQTSSIVYHLETDWDTVELGYSDMCFNITSNSKLLLLFPEGSLFLSFFFWFPLHPKLLHVWSLETEPAGQVKSS